MNGSERLAFVLGACIKVAVLFVAAVLLATVRNYDALRGRHGAEARALCLFDRTCDVVVIGFMCDAAAGYMWEPVVLGVLYAAGQACGAIMRS